MQARYELDRQIIKKSDSKLKQELINKGYNVLRKSKSTVVMVLWGEKKSDEVIASEIAKEAAVRQLSFETMIEDQKRVKKAKADARKEMAEMLTISNIWRHFCRQPQAYKNLHGNSFYFTTKDGRKVRVSDHESWHFQVDSERTVFSRASSFEEPDFDFVLEDMSGMTKSDAVEHIRKVISAK